MRVSLRSGTTDNLRTAFGLVQSDTHDPYAVRWECRCTRSVGYSEELVLAIYRVWLIGRAFCSHPANGNGLRRGCHNRERSGKGDGLDLFGRSIGRWNNFVYNFTGFNIAESSCQPLFGELVRFQFFYPNF